MVKYSAGNDHIAVKKARSCDNDRILPTIPTKGLIHAIFTETCSWNEEFIFVGLPLATCDLSKLVEEKMFLTSQQALQVIRDVLHGLCALEAQSFCHLDLKPNNILFFKDTGEFKISDPGYGVPYGLEEKKPL